MTLRKKKATFYLPEDLLRVARVHAARTDRRDSQVVEQALRAYLGYDADTGPWASPVDEVVGPATQAAAGEALSGREDEQPEELEQAAPIAESPVAIAPPPAAPPAPPRPLDAESALGLALRELHLLREEAGAGGS